jgi:hypothetical protein
MAAMFPASRVETRRSISPLTLFSPPTHRRNAEHRTQFMFLRGKGCNRLTDRKARLALWRQGKEYTELTLQGQTAWDG